MEMDPLLLGVYVWVVLVLLTLVGHVVEMWRKARKKKKDMGRLKVGSVWRQRPRRLRNDPFVEEAPYLVTVLETKVNSDGRMWVKYFHYPGFENTDPADVFVKSYIYAEEQYLPGGGGAECRPAAEPGRAAAAEGYGSDRQPYTNGEMMILGINNYLKRSGKGKIGK